MVWITGASSGKSRALALAFAREGAKVAVSARRKDLLEEVVKQVQELGGEAESFLCDVTNADQISNTVEAIIVLPIMKA